jgi:rhodanese-related sulfurtransferase
MLKALQSVSRICWSECTAVARNAVTIKLPFLVLLCLSPALLQTSMAGEKPFAPESIDGVEIVTAEEAIELMLVNPDMPIIDSRKKTEYVKGHIENAVSLLNTEMTEQDLLDLVPDKNTPILFYCNGARCLRSSDAIRKAQGWGYVNLVWFRGGWKEWSDKRLPMVSD